MRKVFESLKMATAKGQHRRQLSPAILHMADELRNRAERVRKSSCRTFLQISTGKRPPQMICLFQSGITVISDAF
jgi:hypothetical protein